MLGMGMASSHAPMMFQKAQYWPRVMGRIQAEAREHLPHSARVELATPAIIDGHIQRIEAAFATLRGELRAFRPDARSCRRPRSARSWPAGPCASMR